MGFAVAPESMRQGDRNLIKLAVLYGSGVIPWLARVLIGKELTGLQPTALRWSPIW
jgi:hypothetical protein